jgi:hypothetical protein
MGSAPLPLFRRVILPPAFSRAYSGPALACHPVYLFYGSRSTKFPKHGGFLGGRPSKPVLGHLEERPKVK